MRRFLIAIALLAALPAMASAQRRGMMSGGAGPAAAASAPHVAAHASQTAGSHVSSGSHSVAGGRFVRTRSGAVMFVRSTPHAAAPVQRVASGRALLSQDIVPGLGFDYAHVAAVHPQGINGRGRNGRFAYAYFPFYGGGYYLPVSGDDVEEGPAAETQVVDNGQPEPVQTAGRPGDYESRSSRAVPSKDVIEEEEAEPYVFVRRDGTVFFATAYAWENGTLRYITSEGMRHSLTVDKLDLDATQQFNEQRGLSFRLPV